MSNLLRIIQHMRPKKTSSNNRVKTPPIPSIDKLAKKFPGLAMPNASFKSVLDDGKDRNEKDKVKKDYSDEYDGDDNERHSKKNKKKKRKKDIDENEMVDDAMATLEALAPSQVSHKEIKIKKEKRSSLLSLTSSDED